jgi:hypothetical protein
MQVKLSKSPIALVWSGLAAALGIVLLAAAGAADQSGQQASGMDAFDFRFQLENYPPPNEAQIWKLLEGSRAQQQPGGKILVTDAKLKIFNTNGALLLLAETPQCVLDSVEHSVSSSNTLQIRTTDGQLLHEGEGFYMRTNSDLIISNGVHTVIQPTPSKPRKP